MHKRGSMRRASRRRFPRCGRVRRAARRFALRRCRSRTLRNAARVRRQAAGRHSPDRRRPASRALLRFQAVDRPRSRAPKRLAPLRPSWLARRGCASASAMSKALRSLAGAMLIAATPAPATDQAADVVRALLADATAVATVGYRLATANVDLCAEHMVESGLLIETLAQYGSDYRAAAASILKLTDRPTVALVVPGAPAERAGIQAGDVLIDADGVAFAETPPTIAGGTFTAVEAAMTALDSALAEGKTRLTVARGGERFTVDLIGRPACKARFQLIPGDSADALANGTWVQLSTKMVGFAKTPDELAAILV